MDGKGNGKWNVENEWKEWGVLIARTNGSPVGSCLTGCQARQTEGLTCRVLRHCHFIWFQQGTCFKTPFLLMPKETGFWMPKENHKGEIPFDPPAHNDCLFRMRS